jgi:hypothetical protein
MWSDRVIQARESSLLVEKSSVRETTKKRKAPEKANAAGVVRRAPLVLDARESMNFARAILSPAEPGLVLHKAAFDYREKTG